MSFYLKSFSEQQNGLWLKDAGRKKNWIINSLTIRLLRALVYVAFVGPGTRINLSAIVNMTASNFMEDFINPVEFWES